LVVTKFKVILPKGAPAFVGRNAFEGIEKNPFFSVLLPFADQYNGKDVRHKASALELVNIVLHDENEERVTSAIYVLARRGCLKELEYLEKNSAGHAKKFAKTALGQMEKKA